jgi:hypothetical protein
MLLCYIYLHGKGMVYSTNLFQPLVQTDPYLVQTQQQLCTHGWIVSEVFMSKTPKRPTEEATAITQLPSPAL